MARLFVCVIVLILSHYGCSFRFSAFRPDKFSTSYNSDLFTDECETSQLTCVPEEDCVAFTEGGYPEGRICPINYVHVNGHCAFFATNEKTYQRSQAQAEDYCQIIDSRSYYFQTSQEWNALESAIRSNRIEFQKEVYYWIDAYWEDKSRDRWEWRTVEEEIQWEKILKGTRCESENLQTVETENGCLGLNFNSQKNCLLLHNVDCFKKLLFFCKLGVHNSRCSENSDNVCCFSSSYDYYAQNLLGGPGSHGTHGESKAECWINLPNNNILAECDVALDLLGDLSPLPQPIRIEGSYYYFAGDEPCHGDRRAVISSPEVHDFIVDYMMTEEKVLSEYRLIIGLNYIAEHDKFKWDNEKLISYYNFTAWGEGQPNKRSGLGPNPCVAYKKTGINAYSWHLIPSTGCYGENTLKVCELPIRATNLVPSQQKLECGQRLERGVLAKSSYYDFEYNQAQYGEFPWHVAVVEAENYHGGIVMLFACSGALVHKEFVITSAHCVATTNRDFSVSLGDWDLSDEAEHILDTKLVKVVDVIIHPGYKATENDNHDIALLRLDYPVEVETIPHIGLGCLPTQNLLHRHKGPWECYALGWPKDRKKERRVLQRIESDLVSKRRCRHYVKQHSPYYYSSNKDYFGSSQYGYDRNLGFHRALYEQHGYFDFRQPDLFCTEAFDGDECIDDPTAMLVCRIPYSNFDSPFSSSGYDYQDTGDRGNRFDFAKTKIINAYGKERFDSEKWYVMGVGHALTQCGGKHGRPQYQRPYRRRSSPYQLFTPVEDYLSFIHSHTDSLTF